MTGSPDDQLGFAPDYDAPIPYMQRTREYYAAIGYTTPYRWAHYVDAPFQPLKKPLTQSRVTLVTTAAPYDPAKGDQGPGAAYNGSAKFYTVYDGDTSQQHDLRISHIGYDRKHTTATDSGTWFPLPQLLKAAASGRIGEVAPRFFGAPTNRSHRVTIEVDAPEILARCLADGVDAAVLVPNCPVCHQTAALVARHLEANGIAAVVMGCAKDIVEHAAVPRFLFSDFPLGNSAGRPHDVEFAGTDARIGSGSAGAGIRRAHHHAVATALERGCVLEARLQQHFAAKSGRTGPAPRRIRQAEGNRARQPRRLTSAVAPGAASSDRPEHTDVTRPFEGVKIFDFTQVLAGPYASYQLALLGADVIKVERREGEDMRRTPLSREWADRGLAPGWQAINGNKRSLTLDLQKPEAIAIVRQLAGQADVVMENFRPGVMDKLGIGYAALSALNPRLIYCAISGFGQTGPDRLGAGYDGKIQAMSGIMAITGHAETGPTRAGFAVCDVLSGATAAFGVSSALFQRTHTGKGQMVDVSMLEATLAFLSGQVADYTIAGHRQQLSGNQAVSRRPTANLFKAGEGYLLLAVNSEKQYRSLMVALGRADALDDPRFADWFARQQNEPALRAIIEQALSSRNPREWENILEAAGAPCASIWKIEEVIDHPQILARGAVAEIDTPYGRLRFAGSGFQLAHGGGRLDRMAPELGADTDAVLNSLGYDAAAIADLRARGVV